MLLQSILNTLIPKQANSPRKMQRIAILGQSSKFFLKKSIATKLNYLILISIVEKYHSYTFQMVTKAVIPTQTRTISLLHVKQFIFFGLKPAILTAISSQRSLLLEKSLRATSSLYNVMLILRIPVMYNFQENTLVTL